MAAAVVGVQEVQAVVVEALQVEVVVAVGLLLEEAVQFR